MTTNTLSTTVKEIENCRFEINLSIPYESYRKEYVTIKKDIAKNLKLPGFRTGKVPDSMVEKKFKPSIEAKTTEKIISQSYQESLEKEKWKVFGAPELQDIPKIEENKEINVTLVVDKYPSCTTDSFEGVNIKADDCELEESDIKKAILRQLRTEGKLESSTEVFSPKHMAKCDVNILSKIDDEYLKNRLPFKDITFDATLAEKVDDLGADFGFLGLGNSVLGLKEGEKNKITKKVENSFGMTALQGKKIEFEIEVKEIKKIVLPEINDELLKKWGYESEDDMRTKIKKQYEDLIVLKKKQNREALLLKELRKKNKFEMSSKFIDHIISNTIENEKKQNPMMAQSLQGQSFEKIKDLYEEKAIIDIQNSLLLNRYLENNKTEVAEEELSSKIEELAKTQNQDVKQFRRDLIKSGEYTRIKNNLNHEKLINDILSNGKESIDKKLSFDDFFEQKVV